MRQGYLRSSKASQASGDLVMRELASEKIVTVKRANIERTHVAGSSMPAGMTTTLTRPQVFDLVRYLSEQGKSK